ncbi:oligoribonuclease, mitochondrial-like isoform X2 [Ornithodoros turicata]|uniref:oligoribonuclease, mitochondrial-like isoform X2 n=2 Tax=Ornithodoros turicata TaxID=34597 RepID=UPI003139F667
MAAETVSAAENSACRQSLRRLVASSARMASVNVQPIPGNTNMLVWVDLELTGLNIDKDRVMEMACVVTDGKLNVVAEAPTVVVHQPDDVLESMNEWCKENHGQSGLTQACKESKMTMEEAEKVMLDFVRQYTPPGKCPLAGNTVFMDRLFLARHMPEFEKHLHYRIVDVSSVKELCKRWYPQAYRDALQVKSGSHRALADIKESIAELKFYQDHIFR